MRERAKSLIGRDAKDVLICTFHALGVRMMRQDGAALGLKPQFSIDLDSDDVTSILKDAAAHDRCRHRASMAMGHQPVEEHGPERRAGRGPGQRRQRKGYGPRYGALRGAPGGLPERGLRTT